MALTAYCKKCNREVAPGDICPLCGTKLAKTATHAAWVTERRPVTDWMCWNGVMRWLLPAGLAVLILVLIAEGVSGGVSAVEKLFQGEFPWTLLLIFLSLVALIFLALLLQGKELMDYVIDSRGVHVTRYLPQPTALKLLARLKSPRLMDQIDPEAENPVLRLEEQDLPWRAVARVQLWPEKCYILFYAPAWWLRIPVQATPFSWDDALYYVRDKLGKKKAVDLPEHLRVPSVKKAPAHRAGKAAPAAMGAPKSTFATAPETALDNGAPWPETTEMEEKNDEPPLSEARRDEKERMD
ncbi:MAG: zinc ribbon domain-containing protein [Clostridia bacterium]|nr:zinc ribbon domain-containing protein [Clostridia bacterium]